MYSIVLMAALTTAPEAPDFGRCRCGGCRCGCCSCYCGGYCGGCCYGGGWCHCRARCHCGGWCGGYCHCGGYVYCGGYCGGCCGGYGGYGGYGYSNGGAPYYGPGMPYQPGYGPGTPGKKGEQVPPPKKTEETATLVVTVPQEARLLIDGNPMKSTSSRRVFVSPPLLPGREYYYTLRAEVVRDGQVVATEERAYLRAGSQTTINLQLPAATVAASGN